MKWSSSRAADAVLLASFILAPLPAIAQLDCKKILADKTKFDFSKLAGPHSVITTANTPPVITNTTYTVDLCASLKRKGDPPKTDRCPGSTRLCAISREKYDDQDKPNERPSKVIPIVEAGLHNGKEIEPKYTRLKTSASNADAKKEGVRLELHGGEYAGTKQRAIIEMLCKDAEGKTFKGTEGELPGDFEYESKEAVQERSLNFLSMRDAEEEPPSQAGEQQVKGSEEPALVWESYKLENDYQTLRLTWHTKYACEASANSGDASSHWGFFTWFVVLVFLGTAAYLIFGSWLNYNRYGARGWDLLPHGDTIRDVPFLLKDWTRRLINTLQGSGSRGGYSAV